MLRILIAALCLLAIPLPATAFDRIFSEPCAQAGIPKSLALAIARQESGLHPWCVNVQGKDYVPRTYEEAVQIIQQAHSAGKSYDVGLMQINSQWTRLWKMNPLELLDPETNIRLGLKILKEEINRHGMNWIAVGKYHSPHPERGRKYAWRVFNHLREKDNGKALFDARKAPQLTYNDQFERGGIWRNRGIKRKGRLITFRVREEGLPRGTDTEPGGSSGEARPPEN